MVLPTPKSCKDDRLFWLTPETLLHIRLQASLQDSITNERWCMLVSAALKRRAAFMLSLQDGLLSLA